MQQINFQDPTLNPVVNAIEEFANEVRKWDGKEYILLSPALKQEIDQACADFDQAKKIFLLTMLAACCTTVAFFVFSSPYLLYSSLFLGALFTASTVNFIPKKAIIQEKLRQCGPNHRKVIELFKRKVEVSTQICGIGATYKPFLKSAEYNRGALNALRRTDVEAEERDEEDVNRPQDLVTRVLGDYNADNQKCRECYELPIYRDAELIDLMNERGNPIYDLPDKIRAFNQKFIAESTHLSEYIRKYLGGKFESPPIKLFADVHIPAETIASTN